MLKLLAVLRTAFLVFIIVLTVRAMVPWADFAKTLDEQYARCAATYTLLRNAAWLAIGWIFLETAVGWWLAMRPSKAAKAAAKLPPSEPPFAPPPRGS